MRLTGWALVAIGAVLFIYAGVNYLMFDVTPVERAGTVNSAGQPVGMYWLALIPAAAAVGAGLWMVLTGGKGYQVTYDMGKQHAHGNP